MNIILSDQILKIRKDGIDYLDLNGKELFINFQECYINWLNYQEKNTKNFSTYKYIGQRNVLDNISFIEFFTRPFTRIKCSNIKDFKFISNEIIKFGWQTIDLS